MDDQPTIFIKWMVLGVQYMYNEQWGHKSVTYPNMVFLILSNEIKFFRMKLNLKMQFLTEQQKDPGPAFEDLTLGWKQPESDDNKNL